jgi:UDP-N-acetylglucosamine 1-carboxyvinyltransferase
LPAPWSRAWAASSCPPPGGDVIGRRRLDTHFHAFESLGATVDVSDVYDIQAAELVGADIFMDEASVTATENALTVAALAKGTTILRNCASEPHVCALARMLVAMGAHIDGIGTNTLRIEGVARLGGTEHEVESDYLEIGSLIGLAAVTRSELTIHKVMPANLRMIRMVFERLGVITRIEGNHLIVPGDQPMEIRPDYHNQVPKIDDAPGRPSPPT